MYLFKDAIMKLCMIKIIHSLDIVNNKHIFNSK